MLPIKKLFGFRKNKELDKSIIQKNPYKNNTDLNKRQFIKKGLLGLAGLGGLALASKIAKAGGLVFNDGSTQTVADGWVELQSVTASSSATVDLETDIGGDYDEYMIVVSDAIPSTDGRQLFIRLKVGGSYQTSSYQYHSNYSRSSANTYAGDSSTSQGYIDTNATGAGNASNESGYNVKVYFSSPDSTSTFKGVTVIGDCYASDGNSVTMLSVGHYEGAATALTGVRFYMSTDNISSGIFTLYGLKKA